MENLYTAGWLPCNDKVDGTRDVIAMVASERRRDITLFLSIIFSFFFYSEVW